MDKVKQYLEMVRKFHFWILCVFAAVIGLVVWKMSSGKLSTEFQDQSQKITSTFASLQTITNDVSQPHTGWAEGKDKQTESVRQDVIKAWQDLYKQQREQIFVWPKALGDDFLKELAKVEGTKNELPNRMRDRYLNMVRKFVAQLPTIVDAAPLEDTVRTGTGGGSLLGGFAPAIASAPANAGNHTVTWESLSISNIAKSFEWEQRPSTLLVRMAQEELWVYTALCNVIKSVNEGSTSNTDAPIKAIMEMKIAYPANETSFGGAGQKRIFQLVAAADATPGGGGPVDVTDVPPEITTRGKPTSERGNLFAAPAADASADTIDDKWKKFRYVDAKGSPITDVAAFEAPAEENKQFNLMPFQLLLNVDDRYIDRLLVAFRNSPLPIEVKQVRINPQAGGGNGSAMDHGRGMIAMAAPSSPQDRTAVVDIRGVVYLIKPVDQETLQAIPAGDAAPADATAPPGGATAAPATPAAAATPAAPQNG